MQSRLRRVRYPALALALLLGATYLVGPLVAPAQHAPKGQSDTHPHDDRKDDKKDAKDHDDHKDDKAHDDPKHNHKDGKAHDDHAHEPTPMEHVLDTESWHFFDNYWPRHWDLPRFGSFQITKFMVLEIIAALLIVVIYVPLSWRIRSGEPARGWIANMFEVLLTFVRDQIARPNLGANSDRYVPFLWTLFLFILFNNLLGMFPFGGSATASIFVTGALALIVFFAIHGGAIVELGSAPEHGHDDHGHDDHGHDDHGHGHHDQADHSKPARFDLQLGVVRYAQSMWPQIDLPMFPMGLPIKLLVFFLEVMGVLVRNLVLAIRLFANMFAGHMVIATILLFIRQASEAGPVLWGAVTFSSVFGIVALSLLEIFVAFLQAYIFTFLTSLFMGMAMHPQH